MQARVRIKQGGVNSCFPGKGAGSGVAIKFRPDLNPGESEGKGFWKILLDAKPWENKYRLWDGLFRTGSVGFCSAVEHFFGGKRFWQ
ncbi:MAG: hypothetical protein ACOX5Z_04045 [Desulfobulbus sp.]|jgi:hypothetical protein